MARGVPAWMQQPCFLVFVFRAGAAHLQAVQDFKTISPQGSTQGAFIRSEDPHKNSLMRSQIQPTLWADNQQHLAHDEDERDALVEADHLGAQKPAGDRRSDDKGTTASFTADQAVPVKSQHVATAANQKVTDNVSTSIGVMLLGMVAFTMSLFYAVHFPDADVQHTTWVTMSETMSLFCGVLLFTSFKDIMVLQFGESGGHHDSQPTLWSMILSLLRTLLLFWGVQDLLRKYKQKPLALKACGSIGGNIIAFAAIDCFGMIQQVSPFRDNPGNAFLGMCIAGVLIGSMCFSAHIVRHNKMTKEDGIIKEHDMKWDDACKQVENQFASICLGLLFSIVVRQAITGQMPAVWGSPHNKTQEQVNKLFGVSLGFSVPVFAISIVVLALKSYENSLPGLLRSARVSQLILSMCMGWSLVFCGQWEFWSSTSGNGVGLGDKMTARMIDALVFSYMSFGFIIALDFLADNVKVARGGFQAVSCAFTLGLGLAWQGAFSEAISCLSNRFEDKTTRAYMDVLITLCLCGIVMPAWVLYMLPKALAGPQPLDGLKTKGKGHEVEESEKSNEEGAGVSMGKAADEVDASTEKERCNHCGAEFEGDVLFCENCGAKRPTAEELESGEKAGENPVQQPSSSISAPGDAAGGRAAGGKGNGKAAASVGKGGRGSGRASATSVPAASPTWDDQAGGVQQEKGAEEPGGREGSLGVNANVAGDLTPSF